MAARLALREQGVAGVIIAIVETSYASLIVRKYITCMCTLGLLFLCGQVVHRVKERVVYCILHCIPSIKSHFSVEKRFSGLFVIFSAQF